MGGPVRSGHDTLEMGHVEAFYARAIARAGRIEGRVLDAGCGAGALLACLRGQAPAARGIGVDLDTHGGQLSRAIGIAPVARGDLARLPFRDGSFDAVFCVGVLSYVADPAAAVRELARSLKPGGRLFVAVPERHYRRLQAWKGWLRLRFRYAGIRDPFNRAFSRTEGRALLEAAGLRVAREEGSGPRAVGNAFLAGLLGAERSHKRLWYEAERPA